LAARTCLTVSRICALALSGAFAEPDRLCPSVYVQGPSKDLGGIFQFRTELRLRTSFDGGAKLGARILHLSNAGIHHCNPGEEGSCSWQTGAHTNRRLFDHLIALLMTYSRAIGTPIVQN
jgi:hypothetical protein